MKSARYNVLMTNIGLIILLAIICLRKIGDYDIWYHLVIGREINNISHIPSVEFYVYPLLGQITAYHEWGFGLLFYKVFQCCGYYGMNILNALINVSILLMLYNSVKEQKYVKQVNINFIFIACLLTYFRMAYRPEMILFLCMSMEIYLLEKYSGTRNHKFLIPIPLIAFILGMFHPSAIFLIFVYICYAVQATMEDIKNNESNLKIVLIVLFTSIAASTVNPYGVTQLILPFKFALQNDILTQNSEFRPMMQTDLKYIFIINCLVTLAALAVKGNRKISYYLLYAAFGYLAIKYHRNYALFILALYVPTVTGYQLLLNEYKRVSNKYLQKTLWLSVITIAACVMVLTVKNDGWGLGKVEGMFPEKSADFIQKNKPEGKIFNYYELGGYLGWRLYSDYSVSIDGRHYYYDTSYELHDKVFWHCDDWENILKKLDVNTIIVPATSKLDARIITLLYYLDASRDWILVNEEPSALLFMRKEQADKIKSIDKLDKDLIWVHVIQDAKTAMILYDERNQSYFSLAIANFKLHGFPEALNCFKLYSRVNPQDAEVQHMISLLDASEAGDFKAQAELEKMFKNGRNL